MNKKISVIIFLFLFLTSNSFAGTKSGFKLGKGSLKLSKDTADWVEYYFSGGKKGRFVGKIKKSHPWKPGLIAISIDGKYNSFFRHPKHIADHQVDNSHYSGMAIQSCKKKSGQECYIFANGYKIKWDNGTSVKSRIIKKKDIKAGKTIVRLTELGFYDGGALTEPNKKSKTVKKNNIDKDKIDGDIVSKLKDLKDLFDSGALTKEEYSKAKKKLLN
jgi:hypothetical protein